MSPIVRVVSVGLVVALHTLLLWCLIQPHYALLNGSTPDWKKPPVWISAIEKPRPATPSPTIESAEPPPDSRASEAPPPPASTLTAPGGPTYFDSDQLDKKADPVGEWIVDGSAWPHELKSVQIELWINDAGQIEHWDFLNLSQPSPELLQFLRPLPRTPMNPAWRRGKPVHSRLRIELFLDA